MLCTAILTDANGQFGRSPSAVGLTIAVGSAQYIESRVARIGHTAAVSVTVAFVTAVKDIARLSAGSSCQWPTEIRRSGDGRQNKPVNNKQKTNVCVTFHRTKVECRDGIFIKRIREKDDRCRTLGHILIGRNMLASSQLATCDPLMAPSTNGHLFLRATAAEWGFSHPSSGCKSPLTTSGPKRRAAGPTARSLACDPSEITGPIRLPPARIIGCASSRC